MKSFLLPILLVALATTSGCGWFSREKSAVIPAELDKQIGTGGSAVAWSRDVGAGSSGLDMKLEAKLSGGSVYVADTKGRVTAVNAATGNSQWSTDVNLPLRGGPGVGEGLVVVASAKGDLVALDASNGKERWRAKVLSEVNSVPMIASGMVVAHANDGRIIGFDSANGERRWSFQRPGPTLRLRGTAQPVADGSYLYSGLDGGKLVKIDIASGRPAWEVAIAYPSGRTELERVVDIDSSTVIGDTQVFTVSFQGDMAAVEKNRGTVTWRRDFSSHQGLVLDGAAIYASDSRGAVVAIDRKTGEQLWRNNSLAGRQLSAPAVAGGKLAVADLEGYVHWLSLADGRILARVRPVSSAVKAPLVADGNRVIVYGSKGQLAAVTAP